MPSRLEKPDVDATTLDRIDVCYSVTATFVINAGVYSGVMDREALAEHINSMGVDADHIDEVSIIEVTVDDKVVARAP